MPLQACSVGDRAGFKWGASGKCYSHDGTEAGKKKARKAAIRQGLAAGGGKLDATPASGPQVANYAEAQKCATCGKMKAPDAFPKDGRTKSGTAAECAACKQASSKSYSLETVDIPEVEIMAAGVTVHGGGSPPEGDTYTVDDLRQLAEDSNAVCADLRPPVKIGHSSQQRLLKNSGLAPDEQPRAGSLENFRVMGDKLVCDLKQVPKKLAELFEVGAFRLRSTELRPVKSQRDQKVYKQVVSGLAFLGTVAPAFQTLDDIHKWFAGVEADTVEIMAADADLDDDLKAEVATVDYAVGDVVWDGEDGLMDIMDDLNAALNPGPADPRYWVRDVRLMDVDGDDDVPGPAALVQEYGSGATWVVPFTFEDGEPTVAPYAQWVLAEQMWVQTGPDAGGSNGGDASRENADRVPDADADTREHMAATDTKNTSPRPKLTEDQVKEFAAFLGLGEDADEEKVYAELDARKVAAPAVEDKPDDKPAVKDTTRENAEEDGVKLTTKQFTELVRDSQRGAEFAEKFRVGERDSYLKDKVREGRIMPAQVKQFSDRYDEDEDFTRTFLEALPVNDEWVRTYGADYDGSADDGGEAERFYAEMCGALGVEYDGPLNNVKAVA